MQKKTKNKTIEQSRLCKGGPMERVGSMVGGTYGKGKFLSFE